MTVKQVITLALVASFSLAANAASTIRLVYDPNYRACMDVKRLLESPKFKTMLGGKYKVECVIGKGNNNPPNDSLKMPCIYVIDEKNRCYFVFENVPYNYPGERLAKTIDKVNTKRQEIESKGMATADDCGRLLFAMERFVGGAYKVGTSRVVRDGFYKDVFDKLKQLDPKDETGWVKHFTFGDQFDKNNQKDGLEYVIEANAYRQGVKDYAGKVFVRDPDPAGGQKWIAKELADAQTRIKEKRNHLTPEQLQSLFMAKFETDRTDPAKKEECIKLLQRVAKLDETTFWGIAACGWLNWWGVPPLSTYWGWHKGDFIGPQVNAEVKYGVKHSFAKAGDYEIDFRVKDGNITISQLTLCAGEEEVKTFRGPPPYTYKLERAYEGRIDKMIVKGTTASDSEGEIYVHRRVLRPRKGVK